MTSKDKTKILSSFEFEKDLSDDELPLPKIPRNKGEGLLF